METKLALALKSVPDHELLSRLCDLVSRSRRVEADLVAHIGEVDERRLFAREAFPSMFAYCTEALHLSEADAYRRITVARAARKHPELLEALRVGRVHLSGLALLVSVVNTNNCAALLARAAHRTRRQIEELVAELSPRPDAPSVIRKLPERRDASRGTGNSGSLAPVELFPGRVGARPTEPGPAATGDSPTPADPSCPSTLPRPLRLPATHPTTPTPSVQAISCARFKVQFTASAEFRDKLERLAKLLRSEIPDGDLAAVIERAVSDKLDRLEARRLGRTTAPRTRLPGVDTSGAARHIPAAVRRAVADRDGSRCRFVSEHGRRCSERSALEFHHLHPFAMGGGHSLDNVQLLCPQHNRLVAEHDFGRAAIRRRINGTLQAPARTVQGPKPDL
jgi:hypothetical protein